MKRIGLGFLWGWIWAVGTLFLTRVFFQGLVGPSLPWVLGAVLGLRAKLPGGLMGALVASVIMDSWSLRPLGQGILFILLAKWVVTYTYRLFELTGLAGQALSLALALALARISDSLFGALLEGFWQFPQMGAVMGSWFLQVGLGLLLMRALPSDDRYLKEGLF